MGNDQSQAKSNLLEKSSPKQSKSGIVVVKRKTPSTPEVDDNVAKLSACPTFNPLLPAQFPESRPLNSDLVHPLDHQSCYKICLRLQEHLEKCAEAVKFDQAALIAKIKDLDRVAHVVMQRYTERQRAHAKHAEHSRKLDEISASLTRLRVNLDNVLTRVDELNMLLPEHERLENFSLL